MTTSVFSEMNHGFGDTFKSAAVEDAFFAPLSNPSSSSMGMGSSVSQMMSESMSMVDGATSLSATTPATIGVNDTLLHDASLATAAVGFEVSNNSVGDDEDFGDFEEATFTTAPILTPPSTTDVMGSISILEKTLDREDDIVHTMEAVVLSDAVSDMISPPSVPVASVPVSIEEFTKLNFDSFMVTSNVSAVSTSDDYATSSAISEQLSSPLRPQPSSSSTTAITTDIQDSSLPVPEIQSMPSPMGFNALDQLVLEDMDEPIPLTTDLLTATTNPADSSLLAGSFIASFGSSSSSGSMGMNTMASLPPFHNKTHSDPTTTLPTRKSILDLFDTNTASSSSQRDNYSALEVSSNLDDAALHTLAIQLADKKYFEESHCCFQKLAYRQAILALHKETKQDKALEIQRRLERQKVRIYFNLNPFYRSIDTA